MTNQTGNPRSNLITNVLLGIIIVLLIAVIVLFASAQSRAAAQSMTDAANREAVIDEIAQISQDNQIAIEDLYQDYVRDRGYHTEEEEDYLLKQALVGDEYILHALMFLAAQNNQILELIAGMK